MPDNPLLLKALLQILFKTINKSANFFADAYLLKDVSIISKWKSGKVIPKNEDMSKVVEFALKESTQVQQKLLREQVESLIKESSLDDNLKAAILETDDFSLFLKEALTASILNNVKKDNLDTNIVFEFNPPVVDLTDNLEDNSLSSSLSTNKSSKIQGLFKYRSIHFNKKQIYKVLFSLLSLFVAVLIIQQLNVIVSHKVSDSDFSNVNPIKLSNAHYISYIVNEDSVDRIQVKINDIPLKFTVPPRIFNGVLYLPSEQTFSILGFITTWDQVTNTMKSISNDKAVELRFGRKEVLIDNKQVHLEDEIILLDGRLLMPAYILKYGFDKTIEQTLPYSLQVTIDNKHIKVKTPSRIVGGNLFLPLGDLFSLFEFTVTRELGNPKTITAVKKDKKIVLKTDSANIIVDNKQISINSPIFISGNKNFVPAEIIKCGLDMEYQWVPEEKILNINSKGAYSSGIVK